MSRCFFFVCFGLQLACSSPRLKPQPVQSLSLPAVDEALPNALSEFGLYPRAPDLSVSAPGAFLYEPRFPLWSNGSAKQRFVASPAADAAPEPQPAELAPGTVFFKTFSFELETSPELVPVETRVMRLGLDGWEYYRYLWNDADDATLLTSRGSEYVTLRGRDQTFDHEVPSDLDCKRCHEASDNPVLGYRDIQLNEAPFEAASDPMTAEVMGYVVGNCVHCHNGGNTDANSFDLRPEVFLQNTVNRETEGSASGYGIRAIPGDPQRSVLHIALAGGDEAAEIPPMPPLGVQVRDAAGLALFEKWIAGINE